MDITRRFVKMFQPQFADLVRSGRKRQTIRPLGKRQPAIGDRLSLREWSGKPYRSKQRVLLEITISAVKRISIGGSWSTFVDGHRLTHNQLADLAVADGFQNATEMIAWFEATHGLPFGGLLIQW